MSTDTVAPVLPVTRPQARYLIVLLRDRVAPQKLVDALLPEVDRDDLENSKVTKVMASGLIKELKKLDRRPVEPVAALPAPVVDEEAALANAEWAAIEAAAAPGAQMELPVETDPAAAPADAEGVYRFEERTYKVVKSGKGNLYAKDITDSAKGVYAPGVMAQLTVGHRMTVEAAEALSAQIGRCCRCHRTLTVKESVDAGIGPVCRKKI